MKVYVLRLGHRVFRDKRISTHCGLVARAFGAEGIILSGERDSGLEESLKKVSGNWGGNFQVSYEKNWKKALKEWKGDIAHLTVYGMPFQEKMGEIRKSKSLLIVIGGEKVPPEVYQKAKWNISVTGQPHSEVAALGVFMHELFQGKELEKSFIQAKLKVIPQERGKKTVSGK